MKSLERRRWNSFDLVEATGGRLLGAGIVEGVAIDSREIGSRELFVALVGDRFNGHDYVGEAFKAGAASAVVSQIPKDIPRGSPLLLVDDTFLALKGLGHRARADSKARFIGVTGSVGKTGTKEMLRICLSSLGSVHVSMKSHNNAIGVPLTLSNLPQQSDYAVVEMGMNHKGEIFELTSLVRPHVALITSIAETHIGNFENLSEIADAKAEIFKGLEGPGLAILNRDNPFYRQLRKEAELKAQRCLTFGSSRDATVRLLDCQSTEKKSFLTVDVAGEIIRYTLGVAGLHWAYNSLGVIACVYGLGEDIRRAAASLDSFDLMPGRGRVYSLYSGKKNYTLIDESYNASPTSVSAALRVLAGRRPARLGRRIAVLGDMLELGNREQDLHAGLAGDVIAAEPFSVFTVGSRMQYLRDALPSLLRGPHFDKAEEVMGPLLAEIKDGDVILIKGSFSIHMGSIVDALRNRSSQDKVK